MKETKLLALFLCIAICICMLAGCDAVKSLNPLDSLFSRDEDTSDSDRWDSDTPNDDSPDDDSSDREGPLSFLHKISDRFKKLPLLRKIFGDPDSPGSGETEDLLDIIKRTGYGEPERIDIVFGNKPNNLYQSSIAPCFGDGRIYYINGNDELASFSLNGSDHRIHGPVGGKSRYESAGYLNYYHNAVYYMLHVPETDANGDVFTEYTEIRRFDPASNNVETITTLTADGDAGEYVMIFNRGLMVINDDLYYAYSYGVDTSIYIVGVINLISGETNTIQTVSDPGNTVVFPIFPFDSDGRYLYLHYNLTSGLTIYRLPLSRIYDNKPACELVLSEIYYASVVLDDGGFYIARSTGANGIYNIQHDDYDAEYLFYDYQKSGSKWEYDLLMESVYGIEEIKSALFYSDGYILNQSMLCLSSYGFTYYSPSAFDLKFTSMGDAVEFNISAGYGTRGWYGEYEDSLYVIRRDPGEDVLCFFTSDGILH